VLPPEPSVVLPPVAWSPPVARVPPVGDAPPLGSPPPEPDELVPPELEPPLAVVPPVTASALAPVPPEAPPVAEAKAPPVDEGLRVGGSDEQAAVRPQTHESPETGPRKRVGRISALSS